jgi:hypothetical protein
MAEINSDCQVESQSSNGNECVEQVNQSSKKEKAQRKKVCGMASCSDTSFRTRKKQRDLRRNGRSN